MPVFSIPRDISVSSTGISLKLNQWNPSLFQRHWFLMYIVSLSLSMSLDSKSTKYHYNSCFDHFPVGVDWKTPFKELDTSEEQSCFSTFRVDYWARSRQRRRLKLPVRHPQLPVDRSAICVCGKKRKGAKRKSGWNLRIEKRNEPIENRKTKRQ